MNVQISIRDRLTSVTPESVKRYLRPVRNYFGRKHDAELSYWRKVLDGRGADFDNSWYEGLMLAIAGESSERFTAEKVVADFGCGPCGSLAWARSARLRIGIDVLADRYADEFPDLVLSHGMIYVKSTESVIPVPSDFVDVLFTLNAMDHVASFPAMCREVVRILKPGGLLIGSLNLEEPPRPTEPQRLTEAGIKEHLLDGLVVLSYRVSQWGAGRDPYAPLRANRPVYKPGQEGCLWVKARKPSHGLEAIAAARVTLPPVASR
jgi:SAM-dependent methyltransferase